MRGVVDLGEGDEVDLGRGLVGGRLGGLVGHGGVLATRGAGARMRAGGAVLRGRGVGRAVGLGWRGGAGGSGVRRSCGESRDGLAVKRSPGVVLVATLTPDGFGG